MLRVFSNENPYGRMTIPGMKDIVTERRLRRAGHGGKHFFHRSKNGVYDPITYYHVMDTLLSIEPGQMFRTSDLVELLRFDHPLIIWDTVSVGRIVTDIADSLREANAVTPVNFARRWNGMAYEIDHSLEGRAAMMSLFEDLYAICDEQIKEEQAGVFRKRLASPLERCPSLMAGIDKE